jgi:hypothetical protein
MTEYRRQLHYRMKGSLGNDEDWWTLVFDSESHDLYIEHEWDNVPLGGGKADRGKSRSTIKNFLDQNFRATQHSELIALIVGLFEDVEDA